VPKASEIELLTVTLEIGDRRSLFILLAKDGSINRQGTGTIDNQDKELFIGVTEDLLFEHAITYITDDMLKYMGSYDLPDKKGLPCRLSIGFQFDYGEENGFDFVYAAESEGPPDEIAELLLAAVQITEPWYKAQKRIASKRKVSPGRQA